MTMLLFYLFLALVISFFCSLFEAVILSVSYAYAARAAEEGQKAGRLLKKLKSNIDTSLAAILTLNTIAHTIGAAGVGAEVLRVFGDKWVALASVILTLLILVLSEIIPKTLGATYWRSFAPFVAYGIQVFIWISYPLVIAFEALAGLLTPKGRSLARITRSEFAFAAEIGKDEGSLSERESQVIKNLLHLRNIKVKDVMTPRTVLFALEKSKTLAEIQDSIKTLPFSRIPVFEGEIDNVVGLALRFQILEITQDNPQAALSELIIPVHHVDPDLSLSEAIQLFIERKEQFFTVMGEYGELLGIITLEDGLETLLGVEIVDEFDSVEDMRDLAAKKWAKRKELSKDQ